MKAFRCIGSADDGDKDRDNEIHRGAARLFRRAPDVHARDAERRDVASG
jgi:hypothetical protein